MTEKQPKSRREIEGQIIAKAWTDEAFANQLRTDPRAAIADELGVEFPDDLKIEVHEETPDDKTIHLVIPPKPAEKEELDLDAVAGGHTPTLQGGCLPMAWNTFGTGDCASGCGHN